MRDLKWFSLCLSMFIMFTGCSHVKAPEAVQSAFSQQFPEAKSIKWSKESETEYEAEFKLNGETMSANYSQDGEWLETEKEIKPDDVPEPVLKTFREQFVDYKIKETSHLDKPGQSDLYETELKKGNETIEVICDSTGKIISKKNIEEEEDKD